MVSCCSSYTIPAYIWTLLSVLAAVLCPFGLYFSNWLEYSYPDGKFSSFSSFRTCSNHSQRVPLSCEDYLNFNEIYSPAWQAVTLMFGIGACLLILVALTSLFGLCVKHLFNIAVVILVITAQVLGVLLYIAGIIVFPIGWKAPQVQSVCGSDTYKLGHCELGWAFIIIIIGTGIGVVASFMSWTPVLKKKKERDDPPYAI